MSDEVDPADLRSSGDLARFNLDRLAAFSDAVFAIAITLLVLPLTELDIAGDLPAALYDDRGKIIAFVVSFAVIGRYWISHHNDVQRMVGVDQRLLVRNLVLLFFIVVLPFPTSVLGQGGGTGPTMLYATTIILTALSHLALWLGALGHGLTDARVAPRYTVRKIYGTVAVVLGFLPSFAIAVAAPGLAQWSWFLVIPFSAIADRLAAGRRPRPR